MSGEHFADVGREVAITVADDDDAHRISAVLAALGYRVVRRFDDGDASSRHDWTVACLCRRYKLTDRERAVLARVLDGQTPGQIADGLGFSRATVKWHLHNVFNKTNTGNRAGLLCLALHT